MKPILYYYLEANVYLLVFVAFYWVFLRQETQFQFNRMYLLLAMATSLAFPLISLEGSSSGEMIQLFGNSIRVYWLPEVVVSTGEEADSFWQWVNLPDAWGMIKLVYFTGFSVAFLVFALRLRRLLKIIYQSETYRWDGCLVAELPEEASTFSFFNFIFIGQSASLTPAEKEEILRHERMHVARLHSVDVLLSHIIGILFWFNPLVRTYHRLFVQLHEFEADARAVEDRDANEYCQLLARVALQAAGIPLANHFNHSLTVKRISMMQTVKKKIRAWKIAGLIVLFPTAFLIVSCQKQATEEVKKEAPRVAEVEAGDHVLLPSKQQLEQVYTVVEKMPKFPGGTEALMKFIGKNFSCPTESEKLEGSIYVQFEIDQLGKVTNPAVVKGISAECDKEALRVISQMPAWEPGMQNGRKVKVKYVLPIKFKLDDEPVSDEKSAIRIFDGKQVISFKKVIVHGKASIEAEIMDEKPITLTAEKIITVGKDISNNFSVSIDDASGKLVVSNVGDDRASKLDESKRLHF